MKKKLLYILILFVSVSLLAQENGDDWNERTIPAYEKSEEVARVWIEFTPGFTTSGHNNLLAYIDLNLPLNGNIQVNDGKFDLNYIRTFTPKADNRTNEIPEHKTLDYSLWNESITYFDGLGREVQKVEVQASAYGNDIIQSIIYDDYGRQKVEYIPYAIAQGGEDGPGGYRPNPIEEVQKFNSNYFGDADGSFAYAEKEFDGSPLNRVLRQSSPGEAWKLSGEHANTITYEANTLNEVFILNINGETINRSGFYDENTLSKTTTIDAQGNKATEFKDKQSKLILSINGNSNTYYVYDIYGLLRYVISPEAYELIAGDDDFSGDLTTDVIKNLCYYYQYDDKKRMTHKKLPGNDIIFYIYNRRDQVILVQDGEQRKSHHWLFTKYDVFNRPIITGRDYFNIDTQENMQGYINSSNPDDYEEYNGDETTLGYTTNAYPNNHHQSSVYTLTYYNSYDALSFEDQPADYDFLEHEMNLEHRPGSSWGLPTVTKVKVLLEPGEVVADEWLVSATYYDKYQRVIQSISDNHLGGKDIVSSITNFTGEVLETRQRHTNTSEEINIWQQFVYDDTRRLIETKHKINDQSFHTLNVLAYDELGNIASKEINVNDFRVTQKLDFDYNIRGWLTSINNPSYMDDDLFAMKLEYNTAGRYAMYNGNIGAISWKSQHFPDLQKYGYEYDANSRLLVAEDVINDFHTTSYEYYTNGNIKNLNRNGSINGLAEPIDQLSYQYNGNQLLSVNDNLENLHHGLGFTDNSSIEEVEYTYDKNGNLTADLNKSLESSYNYLNLPVQISFNQANTNRINYIYTASGNKLKKTTHIAGADATATNYSGPFVYEEEELLFISIGDGRLKANDDGVFDYEFFIADHLGNTRVRFTESGRVLQDQSYYPFGMSMGEEISYETTVSSPKNKYLYGAKELQTDHDLYWYDYEARFYDPVIGRFANVDPLGDEFPWQSSFIAFDGNPINVSDPTGMFGVGPPDWYQNIYNGDVGFNSSYRGQEGAALMGPGFSYLGSNNMFSNGSFGSSDYNLLYQYDAITNLDIGSPLKGYFSGNRAKSFMGDMGYEFMPTQQTIYEMRGEMEYENGPNKSLTNIYGSFTRITEKSRYLEAGAYEILPYAITETLSAGFEPIHTVSRFQIDYTNSILLEYYHKAINFNIKWGGTHDDRRTTTYDFWKDYPRNNSLINSFREEKGEN